MCRPTGNYSRATAAAPPASPTASRAAAASHPAKWPVDLPLHADPATAATIKAGDEDVQTMAFKAERLVTSPARLRPRTERQFHARYEVDYLRSNMLGAEHGSQVFAVELAKANRNG